MEWNVLYYNCNSKRIEPYNVLKNAGEKRIKECFSKSKNVAEFSELMRQEMMYYYWCKAEWETVISPFCGGSANDCLKIDVYDQLLLNWEQFIRYCWRECGGKDQSNVEFVIPTRWKWL